MVKTRQLVCGTCVGVGQQSIGIANQVFDWVIIDEAARSIPSELAIAMQSGTRILLVGDQNQLPPLYSSEHKKALAKQLGISKDDVEIKLQSDFGRIFDSYYGHQASAELLTQYRMSPSIGNLVSTCFYEGKLETAVIDRLRKDDLYAAADGIIDRTIARAVDKAWKTPGGKTRAYNAISNLTNIGKKLGVSYFMEKTEEGQQGVVSNYYRTGKYDNAGDYSLL